MFLYGRRYRGKKKTLSIVKDGQEGRHHMEIKWKDNFEIRFRIVDGTAIISANRDGLLSLAGQLTALAGEEPGSHIHYDEYNSLEDGSNELIIEKI